MQYRLSLLALPLGALLPALIGERPSAAVGAGSITSIVYHTSYTPSQPVNVWRGLTASLVVNGPGVARAVEIVTPTGGAATGLTIGVSSIRSIPTPQITLALSSTGSAALGQYKVRIHYPVLRTGSVPPDSFTVRLFDRGTITSITKDSGSTQEVATGRAHAFTATGSGLTRATISKATLSPVFDAVTVTSRTTNQVKFSVIPAVAATNVGVTASDFYDMDMPNVAGDGPWSYTGTGAVALTTTIRPTKITFASGSVVEGAQVTATIDMNAPAAPGSNVVVALESSSQYATVPSQAVVTGSTATFAVTVLAGAAAKQATITASSGGGSTSAALSVVPLATTLTSLRIEDPSPLPTLNAHPEAFKVATVTLNAQVPVAAGETVTLSANPAAAVTIPSSVVVAPGQNSVTFRISAKPTDVNVLVNISASLRGVTFSKSLTVLKPVLQRIEINASSPTSATMGASPGVWTGREMTVLVHLTGRVATPQVIQLSTDRPDLVPVPPSITVASSEWYNGIGFTTGVTTSDQSANIMAASQGNTVSRSFTVLRGPRVTALQWSNSNGLRLLATMDREVPVNYAVAATSDRPDRLIVPATHTVTWKSSSTPIPVTIVTSSGPKVPSSLIGGIAEYRVSSPNDTTAANVTIRVRAADTTTTADAGVTTTLQLRPYILALEHQPAPGGLAVAPVMTVSLNGAAPASGAVVTLTKGGTNSGRVTIPATVTIPAGQRSVTYPVTIVAGQTASGIILTASYGSATKSYQFP